MSSQHVPLRPGLADAVHDAQRVFKAAMGAMARPGRPVALNVPLDVPHPLTREAAAILLALADYETPVWLDAPLRAAEGVTEFLSFHTGATIVDDHGDASFVLASDVATMPRLATLRQGTPEYPDRSATLLVQVRGFKRAGLTLEGPGCKARVSFGFEAMPPSFESELAANRTRFPCGVDVLLACPQYVAALPRSVRIVKGE